MDELRTPCPHRGGPEVVVTSSIVSAGSTLQFCFCKHCRSFWLERDGWLLSRREVVSILRTWPFEEQAAGQ